MAQQSGASILQSFEALPIIIVFVLLLLLFMYQAPEVFLAPYIYTTFLSTLPPLILLAAGLTFVIGAGEIDLSFPSIIAFSGFVFAVLFKEYDLGWIAVLAGLASGILVGFLNGVIIAKVGIPSFMTTLGTQFFWAGMATVLSGGKSYALRGAEESSVWQWIVGRPFASASTPWLQQLSIQALWTAIIVGVLWLILTRHRFGEHTLFIGDSNDVSRVVGIDVDREKIKIFTLMGFLAACAAIILTLENKNFFGNQGQGYLLTAIASVLIGGTSIFGGRGDDHWDGVRLFHHRNGRGRPSRLRPHRRMGENRSGPHLSGFDHLLHVRGRTAASAGAFRQPAIVWKIRRSPSFRTRRGSPIEAAQIRKGETNMGLAHCLLTGVAAVGLATAAAPASADPIGKGLVMYMQMGGNPGDGATLARQTGAKEAAEALGVDLKSQFSAWAPETMINQFKEAVAAKPSCIEIMGHPGSTAFHDLVKQAVDQGIVVTSGNSPLTDLQNEFGPKGFGYAGVDLYAGGVLTAKAMLAQGLKSGDQAMVYGVFSQAERGQSEKGLADTLEKAGLKVDRLEITPEANSDMSLAVPILAAYIQAHPSLKAIGTQHGGATGEMQQVLEKAGKKPGDIVVAGIDLAPSTIDGLKSGAVSATLDQLLYMQGFFPVVQCVMSAKYKMPGLSLNTGAGVVTPKTIDALTKLIDAGIR